MGKNLEELLIQSSSEALSLLKDINKKALESSTKLHFNKKHPPHLYSVALYGSLIELSSSIIKAIEAGEQITVPILFRSFVEAHADFCNICNYPDYYKHMEASWLFEWIKVFKEAKDTSNPFLKGISELDDLCERIEKDQNELKLLETEGYKGLSIFHKLEKEGVPDFYKSAYNFLSCQIHNNIRALIDRHIEIAEDDFSVVYFKQSSPDKFIQYIDGLSGGLLNASIKIHEFLNTGAKDDFGTLDTNLRLIRAKYMK